MLHCPSKPIVIAHLSAPWLVPSDTTTPTKATGKAIAIGGNNSLAQDNLNRIAGWGHPIVGNVTKKELKLENTTRPCWAQ